MRNVYFGTSDFAASVLRALAGSEHKPRLVVTRPARPKGRGKKLHDPPVATLAQELGIELFQPEDVNDPAATQRIAAEKPEALTVCAYGAILKTPLLELAESFNVHPSLLPRWRGAAPVERAIQAGDEQTGVTIMRLVEELDAGPMCAQEALRIDPRDDYGTLASELASIGGQTLIDALTAADAGEITWREQLDAHPNTAVTYAEKIVREDRILLPRERPAAQLALTVRALNPHIGAILQTTTGDPLRVAAAKAVADGPAAGDCCAQDGRLLVGTADGALELLRVQPAGGKAMDVESFLRGNDAPILS